MAQDFQELEQMLNGLGYEDQDDFDPSVDETDAFPFEEDQESGGEGEGESEGEGGGEEGGAEEGGAEGGGAEEPEFSEDEIEEEKKIDEMLQSLDDEFMGGGDETGGEGGEDQPEFLDLSGGGEETEEPPRPEPEPPPSLRDEPEPEPEQEEPQPAADEGPPPAAEPAEEPADVDSVFDELEAAVAEKEQESFGGEPGGEEAAEAVPPEPADEDDLDSFMGELEATDFEPETQEEGQPETEAPSLGEEGLSSGDLDDMLGAEEPGPPPEEAVPEEPGMEMAEEPGDALPEEGEESLFEEASEAPPEEEVAEEEPELTDDDLRRIQNSILMLTPGLQETVKRAIVEDQLPPNKANQLVRMLLDRRPMNEIRSFLEENLGEGAVEEEPLEELELAGAGGAPAEERPSPLAGVMPMLRIAVLLIGIFVVGLLLYLTVIKPQITGKNYYEQGLAHLNEGEYTKAELFFERGRKVIGRDTEWYDKYGLAYVDRNKYQRGRKKFNDGLAYEPETYPLHLHLANSYARELKEASLQESMSLYSQANSNYQWMQSTFPDELEVLEKQGDLNIYMGDRLAPEKEKWLERLPEFTIPGIDKDTQQWADKHEPRPYYERAKELYFEITKADWNNLDWQFKYLLANLRLDDYEKVQETYEQIQDISPNAMDVPVMTELAGYYQHKDKWFYSRELLKKILEEDPSWHKAHYLMAKYYREHDGLGQARQHLEAAITYNARKDKDKKLGSVYQNEMGEIYLEDGNQAGDALVHFEKARESAPEFHKPYLNMGDIYYNNHFVSGVQPEEAEKNYDQALRMYEIASNYLPQNFYEQSYYYNKGWLYYRNKNVEGALNAWRNIYKRNSFQPVLNFVMGNAYMHLKNHELALTEYEKVKSHYEAIDKNISSPDPTLNRHRNVYGKLIYTYNNMGVAYEEKFKQSEDPKMEDKALLYLWQSRELADKLGFGKSYAEFNLNYVLHKDVERTPQIAPEKQNEYAIPKTLKYEKP